MNFLFELKYSTRLLWKKPGFTVLCIFVIAVGLAVALPLIVMTRFISGGELPFLNADRFAVVMEDTMPKGVIPSSQRIDAFVYDRLKNSSHSFEELGAFQNAVVTLSDGESAETHMAAFLTPNLMSATGVQPNRGRLLLPEDDIPQATPVVVIGHELWTTYYNSDENIIGRLSRINGTVYAIVGVMPAGFGFPFANDLWLPLQLASNPEPGGNKTLFAAGVFAAGISFDSADLEIKSLLEPLGNLYPAQYADRTGIVLPYSAIFTSSVLPISFLLFTGLTACILILVSFNVGNLLIIRSNERLAEIALRSALGGSRYRTVAQVMLESFLLTSFAVLTGLLLGQLSLSALQVYYPDYFDAFPFWLSLDLQLDDVLLGAGSGLMIWLLAGFYPAWQATRYDLNQILINGNSNASRTGRFTRTIVNLEIIASCFLLILSLSLVLSIYSANRHDMSVELDRTLVSRISLSLEQYAEPAAKTDYLTQLNYQLQQSELFGESVYSTAPPGVNAPRAGFALEDRDLSVNGRLPTIKYVWASAHYFDQLQADLLEGRLFESSDTASSQSVVVVDNLFASQHWPSESAIGKRILFDTAAEPELLTIIGVVRHILQGSPIGAPLTESTLYRPFDQLLLAGEVVQQSSNSVFALTQAPDLPTIALNNYESAFRQASAMVNRDVPVLEVMELTEVASLSGGPFSLTASLLLGVSGVTLVLAAAGIYAVVSRSVHLRSREISIRRALGSSNRKIFSIFLAQAGVNLGISFVIGGMAAVLLLAFIADQMQSGTMIGSTPWVVSAVFIGLASLVLLASYLPVRKVVSMEPGDALHHE